MRSINDPRPARSRQADVRRRHPWLVVLLVAALLQACGTPATTPGSTGPLASLGASARPSTTSSGSPDPPAFAAGALLRARTTIGLTTDWAIRRGQSLYVIAREHGRYQVQHWGDLDTGLRPDTVIGSVDAAVLEAGAEPYIPACPSSVERVEQVAALHPFERLVCFGSRQLTFGPVSREAYSVTADHAPWLAGEAGLDFFTAVPFATDDGVEVPDRGWVTVTGHFDDPGCRGEVRCRERFVVTKAVPAHPPETEVAGTWRRMADSPISGRMEYVAVPTDRGTFIWGGVGLDADGLDEGTGVQGAFYAVGADRWTEAAPAPGPDRPGAAAVWSGTQILIWGGGERRDGLAYDPVRDRWTPIADAPIPGGGAAAAWTGRELIVLSGTFESAADAGRRIESAAWDPRTGRWRRLPDPPLPAGHVEHAWTGDAWIVLGLADGGSGPIAGASYDPVASSWHEIEPPPYTGIVLGVGTAWDGHELYFVEHAFDPAGGAWRHIDHDGCDWPAVSDGVWTGRWLMTQMQAYDPVAGRCLRLPKAPARPAPGFDDLVTHEFHTPFWADGGLAIWSGGTGSDAFFTGPDGVVFSPDP